MSVGAAHAAYRIGEGTEMNDSYMTVSGNVTADPILRTGTSGQQYVTFRLASTQRRFDARSRTWVDGETTYLSVIAFNALAVNIANSVSRGEPVLVQGRVRARTWGDEARQITSLELLASTVGHSLLFGVSRFTRQRREQTEPFDRLADPAVQGDLQALGEQTPRPGELAVVDDADAPQAPELTEPVEHSDPWARPLVDVTGLGEAPDAASAAAAQSDQGADAGGSEDPTGAETGSTWAAYTGDPETDDYLVRRAG